MSNENSLSLRLSSIQAVPSVIVWPVSSSSYGFNKFPEASLLALAISTYSSIDGIIWALINDVSSSRLILNSAAFALTAFSLLLVLAWKYAKDEPAANRITIANTTIAINIFLFSLSFMYIIPILI